MSVCNSQSTGAFLPPIIILLANNIDCFDALKMGKHSTKIHSVRYHFALLQR